MMRKIGAPKTEKVRIRWRKLCDLELNNSYTPSDIITMVKLRTEFV
jgi:hypothetical protein